MNTAIEIDQYGQINVEGVQGQGDRWHRRAPRLLRCRADEQRRTVDHRRSDEGERGSPLVEQLSRPASTPAHDVDVIVTESGHVDLRAADWSQRRALITELFSE